ncbi:hypothetical protein BC830DRAFT_1120590 [Chytriomyces sp. MP71]|nr:hypothetical protein BC830DRAFT_1120590 [Chytriomyces sp. MP71]
MTSCHPAACTNPTVRREFGQLSSGEQQQYIAAVKSLATRPQTFQFANPNPATLSAHDFAFTHARNAHWAHACAEFFVFHRAMLWRYEQALATAGWSGGIVYLDEAGYSSGWIDLPHFQNSTFGGEGSPGSCLNSGQFGANAGYQVLGEGGQMQCLTRCGNPNDNFWDAGSIAKIIAGSHSYSDMNNGDTSNEHANGHIVLGSGQCDVGNPSWSPRDPLFFLHHAYIDKLFWKWQNLCPSYRYDYEGNLADGPVATLDTPLDSWSDLTPRDVLDTNNDAMCYTYSKSVGDFPFTHVCPDGSTPNYEPFGRSNPAPAPTKTATSTGTASPTPTIDINSVWLQNAFIQMINKPIAGLSSGGPPPKKAASRRDEEKDSVVLGVSASGNITATVSCDGKKEIYVLPGGYEMYKATCSRVVVVPIGFEFQNDEWEKPGYVGKKPKVLFPECDEADDEPFVELSEAEKAPCPRLLTDEEAKTWMMDICKVRKANKRILKNCIQG